MPNVYIATSISGGRSNLEDSRRVLELTRKYGNILTEHIFKDDVYGWEQAWKKREIDAGRSGNLCTRDLKWIDSSDFLVAEITQPSVGVGSEIYYALYKSRIPVLTLHKPGRHSGLVIQNENPLLTVKQYEALEDLESVIDNFFYFPKQQGRIFTIEGGDGSGKATQAALLAERLKKENFPVQTLDFPNDKALLGYLIREILAGEKGTLKEVNPLFFASLYAVNRYDLKAVLNHWIRKGQNIILDRYLEANWGHQACKIKTEKERLKAIKSLQKFEWDWLGLPISHKVVYLDLPAEKAEESMRKDSKRQKLDIQEKETSYKEKVRGTFLWCTKNFDNWVKINCLGNRGERIPKEELSDIIYSEIKREFVNLRNSKLILS